MGGEKKRRHKGGERKKESKKAVYAWSILREGGRFSEEGEIGEKGKLPIG
jgi:hypothetical protein